MEAMGRIMAYTGELSYEGFMGDRRTQDAVVRNIEVIGEAVKLLSTGLKRKHGGMGRVRRCRRQCMSLLIRNT